MARWESLALRERNFTPLIVLWSCTMRHPRVLLTSCRSEFLDDERVYPPLANLYLKSYISHHWPEAAVAVAVEPVTPQRLDICEDFDYVGISVMTPQRAAALELARAIKAKWPRKRVILGGPHVKHHWQGLKDETAVDWLVTHDGERALLSILRGAARGRVVTDVLSRDELRAAPRPDRWSEDAIAVLKSHKYRLAGRAATTMLAARGCPELCSFCEEAGTAVRWSSVESIAAQLDDIRALGYRAVYLFDDLFAMSLKMMAPICGALAKRDLFYRCNIQARYFTKAGPEMAGLLAETGCVEVAFGAESGSQTILDGVRKRCTVAQNFETVQIAKQAGLRVKAFVLLGLPGETWSTLRETENFISTSGIDDFQCAVYMPFRGTEIRRRFDSGEATGLSIIPQGTDGEVTGAYGIRGGRTSYEVRTPALSAEDLQSFREYLVERYRPHSHAARFNDDRFFEAESCYPSAEPA